MPGALLTALLLVSVRVPSQTDAAINVPSGLRILVDGVHAHNYLDSGLAPGNRDYHSLFGSRDAFDYLSSQGHSVSTLADGRLNAAALANADTLFINLVSDNLPPFLVEEILAIETFVKSGGNLLVINDHSNAYHHSYKLMPLFEQLGIRIYTESALETKPHILGSGPGWIVIDHFSRHPITRNLAAISFHSGGTVDSNGAVAFLSSKGWGDQWNTTAYGENCMDDGNRGNYGNFIYDEGERTGALAVILARKIGLGKVVVVGDQNVLGNLWLRFGDNYKLLLNIYAWFADFSGPVDYASFLASNQPRVLLLDDLADSRFADYDPEGYYNVYGVLSRYYDTYIHDRIEYPYDLLVISPSVNQLSSIQSDAIQTHLERGKSVVVLARVGEPRLLDEVASAIEESSRNSTREMLQQHFVSGATIQYQYDADRFSNEYVTAPTQVPAQTTRVTEQIFLRLIQGLLPADS